MSRLAITLVDTIVFMDGILGSGGAQDALYGRRVI